MLITIGVLAQIWDNCFSNKPILEQTPEWLSMYQYTQEWCCQCEDNADGEVVHSVADYETNDLD